MNKKKSLLMVISSLFIIGAGLSSCSANNPYTISKDSPSSIEKVSNNLTPTEKVIDIGKEQKGASISFKININNKSFSTKGNAIITANGTPAKTSADIDHFVVYLIKNAVSSGYGIDADFDPIGDAVTGYENGFVIDKNTSIVTFNDVPGSGGEYYYVAVRAIDGSDNDIIIRNFQFVGTTAGTPYFGRVSVSIGEGVQVSDTYKITNSNYDDLPVNVNLDDAIGATLGGDITINDGSNTLPPLTGN